MSIDLDPSLKGWVLEVLHDKFTGDFDARKRPVMYVALPGQSSTQAAKEAVSLSNLTGTEVESREFYDRNKKIVIEQGESVPSARKKFNSKLKI